MVYILLGAGFEEAEALVPADLLRRGNVPVCLVGIGSMAVSGGHGITVQADAAVEDISLASGDMVVLPGGMGGVASIENSASAMALAKQAMERSDLWLAAICAAPTLLARAGIIGEGNHAVCYPDMVDLLVAANVTPHTEYSVVTDGKLITSKGAGTAFDFGLALLEVLTSTETARQVQTGIHYRQ